MSTPYGTACHCLEFWRLDRLVTSLAVNRYANVFTLCSLVLNAALARTSSFHSTLAKIRFPLKGGRKVTVICCCKYLFKFLGHPILTFPVQGRNEGFERPWQRSLASCETLVEPTKNEPSDTACRNGRGSGRGGKVKQVFISLPWTGKG